jgi:3-methyladenine DNA glycosylase AlkD
VDELIHFFHNTKINEVQVYCIHALEKFPVPTLVSIKQKLIKCIDGCDNWWISDALSSVYAKILEKDDTFFAQLKEWNTHTNLWKRRQSIVSLFYYSSLRKKYRSFEESIPLVKNLLHDSEYYVQK